MRRHTEKLPTTKSIAKMLAILSAPGSRGDVNPMVAIGKQLRLSGFEVVISLAEPYAAVAEAADLQVEPVIPRERFEELLGDPVVWSPVHGVLRILNQFAAEFLPLHDAVIRRHHRPGQTVLVSHPLDFASRVFRELDSSTPLVDVHLAPATLRVPSAPARLSPWWFEIMRPAWAVKASYWVVDHLLLDPALRSSLGRFRKDVGLPRVTRYVDRWMLSPDRILAMFPNWFAPETTAVGTQLRHVGFPLDDRAAPGDATFEHPADTDRQGPAEPPIVFTAGTAHYHCRDFFARAVEACQTLGRSGILLSTRRENIPASLPPGVSHATYAPLRDVLRPAAAIVHHGGIGTTSQSLAAGVPQVVRPNAFDQFDNATRVQRLGCGRWLRRDRDLSEVLREVLHDSTMARQCAGIGRRLSSETETGAEVAAAQIARLLSRST